MKGATVGMGINIGITAEEGMIEGGRTIVEETGIGRGKCQCVG